MTAKKAVVWSLIVVAIAFAAGLGWFAHRYFDAPPARDYRAEYRAIEDVMGVPDTHNAAAWGTLVSLAERVQPFERVAASGLARDATPIRWAPLTPAAPAWAGIDEAEQAAALEALDAYSASEVPDRLTALLRDPTLGVPRISDRGAPTVGFALDETLPYLQTLAYAENQRLVVALQNGDDAAAATSFRNAFRLAALMRQRPVAVTEMVSLRHRRLAYGAIQRERGSTGIEPRFAAEALAVLAFSPEAEAEREDAVLRAEAVIFHATLAPMYNGELEDYLVRDMPPRVRWASRAEIARRFDGFFATVPPFLHEGPHGAEPPDYFAHFGDDVDRPSLAPLDHFCPSLGMVAQHMHSWRTRRALLLTACAIAVYRDQHSALPASLDDLVTAGVLEALPADPFAADERLVYRPEVDAPLGYTLYSVGGDLTDNGGTHPPTDAPSDNLYRVPAGSDFVWTP